MSKEFESSIQLSRREFLARTGRFAVGAAGSSSLLLTGGCDWDWPGRNSPSKTVWDELKKKLHGPLLQPKDPGFYSAALPNNLEYESTLPAGIARCTDPQDVQEAIKWCIKNKIERIPRSGGHSYAGYSTTDGLMIDVSLMNSVKFDPSTGLVTVGGGARNADIYRDLSPHNVAITHGRCPSVGVAGLVLGGGIGFNMRAHGLACDQLVKSEIVIADGTLKTIDAGTNVDLFWACRGAAGGNFGINTSFTFQTFPVTDLTAFKIGWTEKVSGGNAGGVYKKLLEVLKSSGPQLGSRVGLIAVTHGQHSAGQDVEIRVLGQLVGDPVDVRNLLRPVIAIARPAHEEIDPKRPYWDAQYGVLAEEGYPGHYRERSLFFTDSELHSAIPDALKFSRQWPGTGVSAQMALFQTDGKVRATKPTDTAFVHRESDWLMTINLQWSHRDSNDTIRKNKKWQDEFYDAMSSHSKNKEAYQNFPDRALKNWGEAYYGNNLARLKNIKRTLDPNNVFDFEQGISRA